ncbi:restriction endonuclease [Streptomyces sp. NPDC058417]|uniref:restriction endonuclease n=1 Tax=unclassified Streptomyces TaxID=2593676 RepID=UPI003653AF6F
MTVPARPLRPLRTPRPIRPARPARPTRRRRFDLRTTAFFFLLLALLLGLTAVTLRTALAAAQHRPAWAVVLLLLAAAGGVAGYRGRCRSARTLLRRATETLEDAAATAADALDDLSHDVRATAAPRPAPAAPAPAYATAAPDATEVTEAVDATEITESTDVTSGDTTAVTRTDHDTLGLYALDPYAFEEAMADLCARDGCTDVAVVGGAGDLGADVTAVTPDGRRLVVQCKCYGDGNKVGSQDLQRFGGTCFTVHEADLAVVVTTSDFTGPALEYAGTCGIVCLDGRDLADWEAGTGPAPWDLPDDEDPRAPSRFATGDMGTWRGASE